MKPLQLPTPRRVLMVSPEHFRVEYAINPFMRTAKGELQKVDLANSRREWHALKRLYETLGFSVEVLPGDPKLPDMVFAANQSLVFWDPKTQAPAVLLSHMRSGERQPEIAHFARYYETKRYPVHTLESQWTLEGNGDALFHPTGILWGAVGPRTDKEVYEEISRRFDLPIVRMELQCAEFYHLDTCFSILNESTVALYPKAFGHESLRMIHEVFSTVIEIDLTENLRYFAGNCHCPNGKDVLLQRGSRKFASDLEQRGFHPHEVDTSEFMKSGGSVFCLKMMLY
jgi:N-dimethylarginine dimethylaminohydrolase